MRKNLFLLVLAVMLAGVNLNALSQEVYLTEVTDDGQLYVDAPDFVYEMTANYGASIDVPIYSIHTAVISTPWMIGKKVGNIVRFTLNYEEWVLEGRPRVFDSFIMGEGNIRYKVRINIIGI